jgi:hypothetical protein
MSTIDPLAARLYSLAEELSVTNRRVIQRDAAGQVQGVVDVPTNHARLLRDGFALMDGAWSHHPESVDAQGRFEQLDAMRTFVVAAAEHVPAASAPMMRERFRQITNAIRLHYDDPLG